MKIFYDKVRTDSFLKQIKHYKKNLTSKLYYCFFMLIQKVTIYKLQKAPDKQAF